jgi:hypothetical protein
MFCKINDRPWDKVIYPANDANPNKVSFMNVDYKKGTDYITGSMHV